MRTVFRRTGIAVGAIALVAGGTTIFAPLASASTTAPYLQEDSKGIGVKCVQFAANVSWTLAGHPPIAIDGDFGPATKAALLVFQHNVDVAHELNAYSPGPGQYCYDYVRTSS
jgi:hypothetical protein